MLPVGSSKTAAQPLPYPPRSHNNIFIVCSSSLFVHSHLLFNLICLFLLAQRVAFCYLTQIWSGPVIAARAENHHHKILTYLTRHFLTKVSHYFFFSSKHQQTENCNISSIRKLCTAHNTESHLVALKVLPVALKVALSHTLLYTELHWAKFT